MKLRQRLVSLLALSSLAQPVLAQSEDMKQIFNQKLSESREMFGTRDYANGANRVLQAASMVRATPENFPGYSAPSMLSTAIEFLDKESAAARANNDEDTFEQAMTARTRLVGSLNSWKNSFGGSNTVAPSSRFNPYVPNRNGPSIGGTNSRYVNTGPGSSAEYHPVHITPSSMKSGPWGPGLGRARVDFSRLGQHRGGGGGGGSQGTNCPNCGHYMPPGVSWCTSCGH